MQKVTNTKFKYSSKTIFGGYFTYWKLFFSLISQIFHSKIFSKFEKFRLITHLVVFKSIWYLFIKPLGVVFAVKTVLEGRKIIKDGIYNEDSVVGKKTFILYLFKKLPIFYIKKRFSPSDILQVLSR